MHAIDAVPPIFYDPQQSHQKTAARKDDIEPRRTLPKGRVGFNATAYADMTHSMNQGGVAAAAYQPICAAPRLHCALGMQG